MSTEADIIGGTPTDWLAIGWFTPDYRPLAEAFAANLAERGIPFHLFARPKLATGWNTLQKPSVVIDAMDAYPGKTLVLMDVDCTVRGDIAPVTDIAGDVGLALKARQTKKGKAWQKRIAVMLCSRVVVFRPTAGARAFAMEWQALCEKAHYSGDETAMTWAFLRLPDVAYAYLGERYKAWEVGGRSMPADAAIVHESAHDRRRAWHSPLDAARGLVRRIERRWFRTGRTKRENIARLG
jgi:hypothetical protein